MSYISALGDMIADRLWYKIWLESGCPQPEPSTAQWEETKPYSQLSPDEKTALAHRLLWTLRNNPKQCATHNPGPMPRDQMELYAKIMAIQVEESKMTDQLERESGLQ